MMSQISTVITTINYNFSGLSYDEMWLNNTTIIEATVTLLANPTS